MRVRRVRMYQPGVQRAREEVGKATVALAEDVARDARKLVPVDTGDLLSTIRARRQALMKARVWVGTDHWRFVEYSTAPHIIRSHGPWPLRNRRTGQVFGQVVRHPGTLAQPFMRPALYRYRTSI